MLILLSPAKTQNFNDPSPISNCTLPQAQTEISNLINTLKNLSSVEIAKLMSISPKLADLNYARFQNFDIKHFNLQNAKPAIYTFEGDVYRYLAIKDFSQTELDYLQKHLLILSGLYGYLRPLDLIQPYRLEMGTHLKTPQANNLYEFWNNKITQAINKQIAIHKYPFIINLASEEYFKSVQTTNLTVPVISIQFKEKRANGYKIIGINAKRARGAMARFIIKNQIKKIPDLKKFNLNYHFAADLSTEHHLCFIKATV